MRLSGKSSGSMMPMYSPRAWDMPEIQRMAIAGVLLIDHADTRVASSILAQYGRRPIRSAIVLDRADDLDISKRLSAKRIQALRQKPLHIGKPEPESRLLEWTYATSILEQLARLIS